MQVEREIFWQCLRIENILEQTFVSFAKYNIMMRQLTIEITLLGCLRNIGGLEQLEVYELLHLVFEVDIWYGRRLRLKGFA